MSASTEIFNVLIPHDSGMAAGADISKNQKRGQAELYESV
jgi:hypothetical protein